jgi:hypothetical protein
MADNPPGSALPSFYGERTADGRVVKRPTADDQEALMSSPGMGTTPAGPRPQGPPQVGSMAFEDAGPDERLPPSAEKRQRWTMDDIRSRSAEEYWRDQFERRRWERERDRERDRDWYPEYRGPQRYIEWEPDERRMPPRTYFSSGSRRSTAPLHYRPGRRSYDGYRRQESDEEYEEDFFPKRATGGAVGGGGVKEDGGNEPPPPTEPESMRLPFTGWMGAFKGRMSPQC